MEDAVDDMTNGCCNLPILMLQEVVGWLGGWVVGLGWVVGFLFLRSSDKILRKRRRMNGPLIFRWSRAT